MEPEQVVAAIQAGGVVPIIRLPDLSQAIPLVEALIQGGVTALEITLTSPGALETLADLPRHFPALASGQVVLGVGSVTHRNQAVAAAQAGVHFVVTPVLDLPTIHYCVANRVAVLPGAFTPTEIQTAWVHGASVVKVFPARVLGPSYLRDILAPLPHLRLMPTGGVDLDNAADFIRAGAIALGVGSSLVRREWIQAGAWDRLAEQTRAFISRVQAARGQASPQSPT